MVNFNHDCLGLADHVVVIEVDTFAVGKKHVFNCREEKVLADHVNSSRKDHLFRLNHLVVKIGNHDSREGRPDRLSSLNVLVEEPLVPLTALDVGHSDGQHDDPPIIVDRREVNLEEAIFVLSLATCANEEGLRVAFDAREHVRGLHEEDQGRTALNCDINVWLLPL